MAQINACVAVVWEIISCAVQFDRGIIYSEECHKMGKSSKFIPQNFYPEKVVYKIQL